MGRGNGGVAERSAASRRGLVPFRDFVAAGLQRIDEGCAEHAFLGADFIADVCIVDVRADQAGDGIDIVGSGRSFCCRLG